MLDPITEKELELMEQFYTPTSLIENLVPENWQAPQHWPHSDTIYLRSYQHTMLNYSYLYANDPKKSKAENFRIKKMAGDGYHFGSRETGKSFLLIIDVVLSIIHSIKEGMVVSDCASHLEKVTEPIANFVENHKFLKIFHLKESRANTVKRKYLTITTETGTVIRDVNEKSDTDKAGDLYQGKHSETRWFEENSFSSTLGNKKAVGAVGSYGRIERLSGIPDLCIGSPMGKILQNKKLKPWIWQLPQYCIAEDSKILMSDFSTKNIQDVKVGDNIITMPEKRPFLLEEATVENKYYNGIKDVILLENGINKLWLTGDHKVLTNINGFDQIWKGWDELKNKKTIYSIPNYITDYKKYYEGMFFGLLESEGSFKRGGKECSIGQKSEKDTLEFLLNYLRINYTKYFDKKDKEFAYFYLHCDSRDYIQYLRNSYCNNYSMLLGFLVGFVIGDGSVFNNGHNRGVVITQKNKCDMLEEALNLSKVRYSKHNHSAPGCYVYYIHLFDLPIYAPFSKRGQIYQQITIGRTLHSFLKKSAYSNERKSAKVWDLTTTSGTFIANGIIVHNCKETWSDRIEQEKIEAYGGANSAAFRLNVLAETVEGAFGFFDMERLRDASEDKGKRVKFFEVGKENFSKFEESLIVERMAGTVKCFIAADLGFGAAPTEIIIVFFDGKKYKYVYNISLFRLSPEEQPDIFYWLYHKLGGAYIALDSTSDNEAMIERLAKKGIPREHLLAVRFNENIEVGFEKDEEDVVLEDKFGDPIMKEMYCETFSYQEMERLFYSGEMRIPPDEKFLNQFTNVICKQTKTRPMFDSKGENHLVQSWQVWSISRFFNEFNTMKNMTRRKRGWGAF